jgi:hypothetical protein
MPLLLQLCIRHWKSSMPGHGISSFWPNPGSRFLLELKLLAQSVPLWLWRGVAIAASGGSLPGKPEPSQPIKAIHWLLWRRGRPDSAERRRILGDRNSWKLSGQSRSAAWKAILAGRCSSLDLNLLLSSILQPNQLLTILSLSLSHHVSSHRPLTHFPHFLLVCFYPAVTLTATPSALSSHCTGFSRFPQPEGHWSSRTSLLVINSNCWPATGRFPVLFPPLPRILPRAVF